MCKGLLTKNNLKLRIKFAKDMRKYFDNQLQSSGICFYLDVKHFIHKINLMDQVKAPKSLVWRKKNEIKVVLQGEIKQGMVAKLQVFLWLYHLVKGLNTTSITRHLVVNYLLNLWKSCKFS